MFRMVAPCRCWCRFRGAHSVLRERGCVTSKRNNGILERMVAQYLLIGTLLYLFPKAGVWLAIAWAVLLYVKQR